MVTMREDWWIPKLRAKVKKVIKKCNVCKVFSTKPYGVPARSRQLEVTGVDFAFESVVVDDERNLNNRTLT